MRAGTGRLDWWIDRLALECYKPKIRENTLQFELLRVFLSLSAWSELDRIHFCKKFLLM